MRPFWDASTRTVVGAAVVDVEAGPPAEVEVAAAVVVVVTAPGFAVVGVTGAGPAVVELDRVDDVVLDDVARPPLPLLPQAAVRTATVASPSRPPRPTRLVPELTAGTITDTVPIMDLEQLQALELTGADGAGHRLGDLWSRQPVILVFLRHFG